jgi:calcium/calmodulin-dependent protein kinase I
MELRGVRGVVKLLDFFVTSKAFHVVQQYARGGDLFDRLARRKAYTESDARAVAKELLETVAAIHAKRYVHRDLKTENLLLKDEISDTSILVATLV